MKSICKTILDTVPLKYFPIAGVILGVLIAQTCSAKPLSNVGRNDEVVVPAEMTNYVSGAIGSIPTPTLQQVATANPVCTNNIIAGRFQATGPAGNGSFVAGTISYTMFGLLSSGITYPPPTESGSTMVNSNKQATLGNIDVMTKKFASSIVQNGVTNTSVAGVVTQQPLADRIVSGAMTYNTSANGAIVLPTIVTGIDLSDGNPPYSPDEDGKITLPAYPDGNLYLQKIGESMSDNATILFPTTFGFQSSISGSGYTVQGANGDQTEYNPSAIVHNDATYPLPSRGDGDLQFAVKQDITDALNGYATTNSLSAYAKGANVNGTTYMSTGNILSLPPSTHQLVIGADTFTPTVGTITTPGYLKLSGGDMSVNATVTFPGSNPDTEKLEMYSSSIRFFYQSEDLKDHMADYGAAGIYLDDTQDNRSANYTSTKITYTDGTAGISYESTLPNGTQNNGVIMRYGDPVGGYFFLWGGASNLTTMAVNSSTNQVAVPLGNTIPTTATANDCVFLTNGGTQNSYFTVRQQGLYRVSIKHTLSSPLILSSGIAYSLRYGTGATPNTILTGQTGTINCSTKQCAESDFYVSLNANQTFRIMASSIIAETANLANCRVTVERMK